MKETDLTTSDENMTEAPLEKAVSRRYAELSNVSSSADLIARGEMLYRFGQGRGELASEIICRWGRSGEIAGTSLPYVTGISRSALSDVSSHTENASAESASSESGGGSVKPPKPLAPER